MKDPNFVLVSFVEHVPVLICIFLILICRRRKKKTSFRHIKTDVYELKEENLPLQKAETPELEVL